MRRWCQIFSHSNQIRGSIFFLAKELDKVGFLGVDQSLIRFIWVGYNIGFSAGLTRSSMALRMFMISAGGFITPRVMVWDRVWVRVWARVFLRSDLQHHGLAHVSGGALGVFLLLCPVL